MTTLNTHVNYTIWEAPYQLSLPLNISFQIPDDDPVRLVKLLIERMDLSPLYQTYSRIEKSGFTTPVTGHRYLCQHEPDFQFPSY